ncbi:bifunctional aspartokinase I/homoserine dehydrogenase I [Wigglesworthia glossinidia endosymbiont of Glossina morsitans morsitans (Yale colony)]|uniref:Bifunctional aspartokinase/homoserine dehydrogenase n=1 Tax=Wigglesworthia glossinidia endosymbiont of Glossina morsitans morsitans (Yale colony) TaxID=1142511 RepID=H6Q4E4_WIGGL|nr:aspartate kinase [Wigglesworthia glossinidia]AFA41004.1 bifunctional aspartokinase I/homoserine dehydrogenase I [Wigglesworthia glossinidia endosymbiont of Glossina morsitans morsitans (Yale colony)]
MRVLKFGGTSISNAKCFLNVVDIIKNKSLKEQIAVVLSAPEKVTNNLFTMIEQARKQIDIFPKFNVTKNILFTLMQSLFNSSQNKNYFYMHQFIHKKFCYLNKLLKITANLKFCPHPISAKIVCIGEIISVKLMEIYLRENGIHVTVINPEKLFLAKGKYLESIIDLQKTMYRIEKIQIPKNQIILMAGFIAGNQYKELVVLGRNGSDYSATILSACLNAQLCEIWTDVNGMYSGNPQEVYDVKLIRNLSYKEAATFSYLGAHILHARALFPIKKFNIPCLIKNTYRPNSIGTIIGNFYNKNSNLVKGITYLKKVSMISIFIQYTVYILDVSLRITRIFLNSGIKIISIIQSESNNNINILIFQNELQKSKIIIRSEFNAEIMQNLFEKIKYQSNLFLISVLGSNILKNNNNVKNFSQILTYINKKIISIIYGGFKSNTLSIVLKSSNIKKDMNKIHQTFFNTKNSIALFIIGNKYIKTYLIDFIYKRRNFFKKKNISCKIFGISDMQKLLIKKYGIFPKHWHHEFLKTQLIFNSNILINFLKKNSISNPIILDCTQNKQLAKKYLDFLRNGFHIISANKQSNCLNINLYKKIRNVAKFSNRKFFYNAQFNTPFSIVEYIKNFLILEKKFFYFSGILSSIISLIFDKLNQGTPFYNIILLAEQMGLSRQELYDTITGKSSAIKLLILARELGYSLELKDIDVEPIISKKLLNKDRKNIILHDIIYINNLFKRKIHNIRKKGKMLTYVSTIKKGKCTVKLESVGPLNPLFNIKSGEKIFIFFTSYKEEHPIILKSFSRIKNKFASSIFNDIFKLINCIK